MQAAYEAVAPDPGHFEAFMARTGERVVGGFEGWAPEVLRAMSVPTLVMVGDHDFVRLEHAVEMFELLPDAQLAVLPGTTHMALTQDRARVLSTVLPFLDG